MYERLRPKEPTWLLHLGRKAVGAPPWYWERGLEIVETDPDGLNDSIVFTDDEGRALAERLARFYGLLPEPDPTAPRYGGVDQPEPGLEQDAHNDPNQATGRVLSHIAAERRAQDARWGGTGHDDRHHDGTGREHLGAGGVDDDRWSFDPDVQTDRTREAFADAAASGTGGWWSDIAAEAVARAFSETDPGRLRRALVVVAAVCVAWIEAIDRRTP